MTELFVAAGGGGDAIGALIVSAALDPAPTPKIVASFSWDRGILDPQPGPRAARDFSLLEAHAPDCWEVASRTRLAGAGRSTLTMLARHGGVRLFLLDPYRGVQGLASQVRAIALHTSSKRVTLVDVGGDVLACGDEPELRSPLADSLALAAVLQSGLPSRVAVAGPGLDGELESSTVRARWATSGAELLTIEDNQILRHLGAISEHPSEATALLAGAILGTRGCAQIRDAGCLVPLDEDSRKLAILDAGSVFQDNKVAQRLVETRSLGAAESVVIDVCGRSELSYERDKARLAATRAPLAMGVDLAAFHNYVSDALAQGATLTTFRKATEVLGVSVYDPALIRSLMRDAAHPQLPLIDLIYLAQSLRVTRPGRLTPST